MSMYEEEAKRALREFASSKYAILAASPCVHGGGGNAGLGLNGETGRFEKLDGFYVLRRRNVSEDRVKIYDVRDYWTQDGFKQEAGFGWNSCYSRRGLRHPFVQTRATLPDLSGTYNASLWFCGFELGGGLDWGIASFKEDESNSVFVDVKSQRSVRGEDDVTSLLPDDYLSTPYMYSVKVNDGFVEYFVNEDLVAVHVAGASDQVLYTGEPYVVRVFPFDLPSAMSTLFELNVEDPEGTWPEYTVGISPGEFRWNSGSPTPSRTYRLYDEAASTLMTSGTYDTGTSHKSHPIPVQGYDDVSVYFRADTDAVTDGLVMEVFTQEGNWRTYATRSPTANDLEVVNLAGRMPLVRIGYEPSADGASITDAEVTMA